MLDTQKGQHRLAFDKDKILHLQHCWTGELRLFPKVYQFLLTGFAKQKSCQILEEFNNSQALCFIRITWDASLMFRCQVLPLPNSLRFGGGRCICVVNKPQSQLRWFSSHLSGLLSKSLDICANCFSEDLPL